VAAKRVLVIDDEDDIREVAQVSLEVVARWDVLTANSGPAGIACAAEHQPDAIVLDVMMPDMDGAATFKHLREHPATRDIPVVLLTAKLFDTVSERNGLEGLSVIAKPFDPLRLSAQIASALGWAS
jgi:CheY-like chemotaxis protein